jgi:hypothetical protein
VDVLLKIAKVETSKHNPFTFVMTLENSISYL